ncbi:MAG: YidC/Oxa1 family membrane protein insertase, partial [Oscillospiraceae bacterium]
IKQQKSMSGQAKMAEKQKELQKRCGTDKARYNEELQKLYEKEGANPSFGCLVSLIPFPIMLGIYYSVIFPLKNTLHIAAANIGQATEYVLKIPGVAASGQYVELEIIKNWDLLKGSISGMFSGDELNKIESFVGGFKFLGLDLLQTPQHAAFTDFLWLIPVLSLVSSWFMTFYMNRSSGVKQTGCMKYMMYGMPLLSVYWAFIMPAAVGFYWVISSVVGGLQSVITTKYFSVNHMAAMNEAQRFVTMQNGEAGVKPLPPNLQKQIADKIEAQNSAVSQPQKQLKGGTGKKKTAAKGGKAPTDYLANKK